MKLFDFGGSDATEAPSGGGEASQAAQSSEGSVLSATRDQAAKTAREAASRSPRRRRGGSDAGNASLTDRELQERVNAKIGEQLQSLHAPEMWEAMLCMPGDAALALTGKDRWKFSEKERTTIGLSGSALAQTMMITNPRALATFMFVSIMASAYLPRAMAELKDLAEARKKKEKATDNNAPERKA